MKEKDAQQHGCRGPQADVPLTDPKAAVYPARQQKDQKNAVGQGGGPAAQGPQKSV